MTTLLFHCIQDSISSPAKTSSPRAIKIQMLTTHPTKIAMNTPPTHALLHAWKTCTSLTNKITHPAAFPRLAIQESHQQLSYKPVNWMIEVTTTKMALAVARSFPRRRVSTTRAARRVLGRRWWCELSSRREYRWERQAEKMSASQATVEARP